VNAVAWRLPVKARNAGTVHVGWLRRIATHPVNRVSPSNPRARTRKNNAHRNAHESQMTPKTGSPTTVNDNAE